MEKVEQGYIASTPPDDRLSEAVIVFYREEFIDLRDLIEIHLYTHQSTANHGMRDKYRSAIYYFEPLQKTRAEIILENFQKDFKGEIITRVLKFDRFEISRSEIRNYYLTDPERPFCRTYIQPKLQLLNARFSAHLEK